jgi:probable F420-dependent oxidoreductase
VTNADLVEQARRSLGAVGAFIGVVPQAPTAAAQGVAVQRLESAGWHALWTNEIVGTDALVRASLWLAATQRIVVGTCIANAWVRPAQTAHAAATQLAQAYPHRFVFGLGVGRAEQAAAVGRPFSSPVATARSYLQGTREANYPRILAANGPKLLAVANELADGALPAGQPPEATAAARKVLGAEKLLVVYVPFTASDTAAVISSAVDGHIAAGADHLIVGMSYDTDFSVAVERLEDLAPILADRDGQHRA